MQNSLGKYGQFIKFSGKNALTFAYITEKNKTTTQLMLADSVYCVTVTAKQLVLTAYNGLCLLFVTPLNLVTAIIDMIPLIGRNPERKALSGLKMLLFPIHLIERILQTPVDYQTVTLIENGANAKTISKKLMWTLFTPILWLFSFTSEPQGTSLRNDLSQISFLSKSLAPSRPENVVQYLFRHKVLAFFSNLLNPIIPDEKPVEEVEERMSPRSYFSCGKKPAELHNHVEFLFCSRKKVAPEHKSRNQSFGM